MMPHFRAELEQVMTWKAARLQKMIQETAHVRAGNHENTNIRPLAYIKHADGNRLFYVSFIDFQLFFIKVMKKY
jgi:hypothetical protein